MEAVAAGEASAVPVPDWLATAFPGRSWQSLRSCLLHVDSEGGAGLDLEASELGYVVDDVDEKPGQDAALCAGTILVAIGGVALLGRSEEELEATFGEQFRNGAPLLLLAAEELRRAAVERDSRAECPCDEDEADAAGDVVMEHGSVVHVHLCSAVQFRSMAVDKREALAQDLKTFAGRKGVRAEFSCPEGAPGASIVLAGVPEEVAAARPELQALLGHNGFARGGAAARAAEAAETIEVEGMSMQSLPARNRRRRKEVPQAAEAPAQQGAAPSGKEAADGGAGSAAAGEDEDMPDADEVRQFEYMDHTADVILHSWGVTMKEAWEQVCVAFFSYMTDLDAVDLETSVEVEATGHDILDLLYHLLDEFLFSFGSEFVICRRIEISEFDVAGLRIKARGFGEKFDLQKHPQGTEIKAITMHQMKILTPETLTSEDGTIPRKQSGMEGGSQKEGFPFECYVLVDI